MVLNGFDNISRVYDQLAKLVFGQRLIESQKYFLNKIPHRSKVLILGGGTGWILTELFKAQPQCEVCYIEASQKMISLAKEKPQNNKQIDFIHGTEDRIPDIKFNVVITNFYLDLFDDNSIENAIDKIKKRIEINSIWVVTDFVNQKWWHTIMLRVMYFFFRVATGIQSNTLPDWNEAMNKSGFAKIESKSFYNGFIETTLFRS